MNANSKPSMSYTIEMENLTKQYHIGDIIIDALRGINMKVEKGEFLALMGASGSGKSTLMNIIGCLDKATSGQYLLDGCSVVSLKDDELATIRNKKIGFVFQGFNLLSRTSAIENVELPLIYRRGDNKQYSRDDAYKALCRVGLKDRIYHEPQQLSGGQQQRVAIARALVNNPSIILADEPTGNLDSTTSEDIMKLFQELNEQEITIILVTHEQDISLYAKRVLRMKDGVFVSETYN